MGSKEIVLDQREMCKAGGTEGLNLWFTSLAIAGTGSRAYQTVSIFVVWGSQSPGREDQTLQLCRVVLNLANPVGLHGMSLCLNCFFHDHRSGALFHKFIGPLDIFFCEIPVRAFRPLFY